MNLRQRLHEFAPRVLAQLEHPALIWAKPLLVSRRLLAFTRRGTAMGVAIGMLAGAIPGPLQVITALALCLALRANVVAAVVATLYSNPFTIVPIYFVAYALGCLLIPGEQAMPTLSGFSELSPGNWMMDFTVWAKTLGLPLLVGLPTLAIVLAISSYWAVQCGWRRNVMAQWRLRGR
jgi:uncharacterized protein